MTRAAGLHVATSAIAKPAPTFCPYCKQPLQNQAAIHALRRSETEYQRKLKEAAAAAAARIATEEIAKTDQRWRVKEQGWNERYEALRTQKRRDAAKLRAEVEQGADQKAQRKVAGKFRSLQQTLQNAVAEKEALQRRLEHLTAPQRGSFGEEDLVSELKQHFPDDGVTRRGRAGDVLHEVFYRAGGERVRAGLIPE